MKIRTITAFAHLRSTDDLETVSKCVEALQKIKSAVRRTEVQTIRLSFQNIDKLVDLSQPVGKTVKQIRSLEKLCNGNGITILNIGTLTGKALTPQNINTLATVIAKTNFVFGSVLIDRWDEEIFTACAKVYRKLATAWPGGRANIKYSTLFHVPPYSPFYPGAYMTGKKQAFAVGLEWGPELIAVSKKARSMPELTERMSAVLNEKLGSLERKLKHIPVQMAYQGIDVSLATSLGNVSTLPAVWKNMGVRFGRHGSLALARAITQAIDMVKVKKWGYNGLMIPILEDTGLAACSKYLTVDQLLHYSSVCGTGLDTVPLPGNISIEELSNILKDVYALSKKWKKPLSARLFPIPKKKRGDRTHINDPYLVEAFVM